MTPDLIDVTPFMDGYRVYLGDQVVAETRTLSNAARAAAKLRADLQAMAGPADLTPKVLALIGSAAFAAAAYAVTGAWR